MTIEAIGKTQALCSINANTQIKKTTLLDEKIAAFSSDSIDVNIVPSQYLPTFQWAENATGKPIAYKTKESMDNYIKSLNGLSQDSYDPQGFLSSIGVNNISTGGRRDVDSRLAVVKSDYKPHNTLWGHELFIQKWFFNLDKSHPAIFNIVAAIVNPILNLFSKVTRKWDKPYNGNAVDMKNFEPKISFNPRFGNDFHLGSIDPAHQQFYGTYYTARQLGFSDAQAQRIAKADLAIDDTSKTGPNPVGGMERHFNLNSSGEEDTRLIWAQKHLAAAIKFAKQGNWEQAEYEIGFGLHGLQDVFGHGQINPAHHAAVGSFPDDVSYNPVSLAEATNATTAYLLKYIEMVFSK